MKKAQIPAGIDSKANEYSFVERVYSKHKHSIDNVMPVKKFSKKLQVEIHSTLEGLTTTKINTNRIRLKQLALFVINGPNKERGRIFTDASRDDDTEMCGVGIFVENTKQRLAYRLKNHTSVTSAELQAIHLATKLIESQQLQSFVIYTDCKSACMILENALEETEAEELLAEILEVCDKWNIKIQWIPSHVAIKGNETADDLAKYGAANDLVIDNRYLLKDILLLFKQSIQMEVSAWYDDYSQEKGKTFYEIQSTFTEIPWFHGKKLDAAEVRTLNRLMTGHDFSKYWLTKMRIEDDPDCAICAEPETAEHVILYCPSFTHIRSKYEFDLTYRHLVDVFKAGNIEHYREIVKFIKEAKLDL